MCDTRTEGTVALQVHLDPWASNLWLIGGQLWVNVGRTSTNTQKTVVSSLKVLDMGWQGEGIKQKDTFLKKRKSPLYCGFHMIPGQKMRQYRTAQLTSRLDECFDIFI